MRDRVVISGSHGVMSYPVDDDKHLEEWSRENWNKIPFLVRQGCLVHLKGAVPPDMLNCWKEQYRAGKRIGCDNVMFHFRTGMAVRNTLRDKLPDDKLPPIKQKHMPRKWWGLGPYHKAQNWDDFYQGALLDLVEQELAKDSKPA